MRLLHKLDQAAPPAQQCFPPGSTMPAVAAILRRVVAEVAEDVRRAQSAADPDMLCALNSARGGDHATVDGHLLSIKSTVLRPKTLAVTSSDPEIDACVPKDASKRIGHGVASEIDLMYDVKLKPGAAAREDVILPPLNLAKYSSEAQQKLLPPTPSVANVMDAYGAVLAGHVVFGHGAVMLPSQTCAAMGEDPALVAAFPGSKYQVNPMSVRQHLDQMYATLQKYPGLTGAQALLIVQAVWAWMSSQMTRGSQTLRRPLTFAAALRAGGGQFESEAHLVVVASSAKASGLATPASSAVGAVGGVAQSPGEVRRAKEARDYPARSAERNSNRARDEQRKARRTAQEAHNSSRGESYRQAARAQQGGRPASTWPSLPMNDGWRGAGRPHPPAGPPPGPRSDVRTWQQEPQRPYGESKPDQVCRDFAKRGECSRGAGCKFQHVPPGVNTALRWQGP